MQPALDLFDDGDLSEPVAEAVRRIAIAGFHALWSGRRLSVPELLGGDTIAFSQAAEHLRVRGRIELSDDGHVIAVHGLCLRPTRHRIEHDRGVVNTWCALDAIGIPAALGIDARARTQCPTCQGPLAVSLSDGEPEAPSETMLWYPVLTGGHLVEDFCSGANLFCTLAHLQRWAEAGGRAGRAMTIDEVAEVGRKGWADVAELLRAEAPETSA